MKQITKKQVADYLNENHNLTHAENLFSTDFEDTRFEIVNDVCKHFTSCWIENSILQADDPETFLRITYANYNNFDHITDIDILVENLNQMVEYREKNMKDFRQRILGKMEKEEDRDERNI